MSDLSILVFPNKFVLGWPENKHRVDDPRAMLARVGEVLSDRFSTDVHHVAYAADIPRRHIVALFKNPAHADKIAAANVRMMIFVADVDHPDHDVPGFVAPDAWWQEEKKKLGALLAGHPGAFVARTRGGYRLVYALPEPFVLRAQSDDDAWTARYKGWLRYLDRCFGIHADDTCSDWTRFYRAPHATRDGVPQEHETIGNPHALGVWAPELTKADRVRPPKPRETFGAVAPVSIGDATGDYAAARIAAGVRYLQTAPLSIQGQHGRDQFFKVALVLVRRLRLPIDVAAELVDTIYNPRLAAVGTATWDGEELIDRLESARDTASHVPPGDVPDEKTWRELASVGIVL